MEDNQIKINHRTMPVFSDRSITASQVASLPEKKNQKKAQRKEGTIRIIFIDSVSNGSVADVVMTPIAAEQLVNGINQSLEKLKKDIEDKNMPVPAQSPPEAQHAYIG